MYMKLLHNSLSRVKEEWIISNRRKLEVLSGTLWSSVARAKLSKMANMPQTCNLTVALTCRLTGIFLVGKRALDLVDSLATAADEAKTAFLILQLGKTLQFFLAVVIVQVPCHGISLLSLPSISDRMDVVLPKVFNLVLYLQITLIDTARQISCSVDILTYQGVFFTLFRDSSCLSWAFDKQNAQIHAYVFNYITAKIYGMHQQVSVDLCHSKYDVTYQISHTPGIVQHKNQQKLQILILHLK